jgi:hypothetical protein
MSRISNLLSSLAVAGFLASASACASDAPSRATLGSTFAAIQVHEAGIERARAATASPASTCAARCDATASSAEHTQQLCDLAHAAADADALTRCDRARETNDGVAGSTRAAQCECRAVRVAGE